MPSPEKVERQSVPVLEKGKVIPESLENDTGVKNVEEPKFETVVDKKGKPLVESQDEKEEHVLRIQKTIDEYKRDKKTSIFDTIAWNARVILRKIAKAIFKGQKIRVGRNP